MQVPVQQHVAVQQPPPYILQAPVVYAQQQPVYVQQQFQLQQQQQQLVYAEQPPHYVQQIHPRNVYQTACTRVAKSTVIGSQLRTAEFQLIRNFVSFQPGEELLILYLDGDEFDAPFFIGGNVFVGVTNMRVFKIEHNMVDSTLLKSIRRCTHQSNGVFKWDKIFCELDGSERNTFGIRHADTTSYFVHFINGLLPQGRSYS